MGDLIHVRFAGGAQGFNWLPVFVAEEQGMFARHGVEIEYLRLGSVDKATAAVRDGTADLAITPPEGAVRDYLAGGSLRIVAANSVRLPMSLIARPEFADLGDLRGARLGTSALTEGTALYAQLVLQQVGLSYPGDYEFVIAGVHTARWAALQAGEIDAAPQPAPWNFLAERQGYQRLSEINDVIPEIVFGAVVGSTNWVGENRDGVERLLAALAEAHEVVNDRRSESISLPIYQRITIPDDPDLAEQGFFYTRDMGMWPHGLAVSEAALDATADLMVRAGVLDQAKQGAVADVFDPTFLTGM